MKFILDERERVLNSPHFPYLFADNEDYQHASIALRLPHNLREKQVIIGVDCLIFDFGTHIPPGWSTMPRDAAFHKYKDKRKHYNKHRPQTYKHWLEDWKIKQFPLVPIRLYNFESR